MPSLTWTYIANINAINWSTTMEKKHHRSKAKGKGKVAKVMHELKAGTLHSGSKKGPVVTDPKQGIAIALSEARKSGAKIPKKRGK
jgi:Family of unknown function (DUF6496)